MNIGKAITQSYSKSKRCMILKMCFPILRVFKHYNFSESTLTIYIVLLFLLYAAPPYGIGIGAFDGVTRST